MERNPLGEKHWRWLRSCDCQEWQGLCRTWLKVHPQDAQWTNSQEIFRWEIANHEGPSGYTWKHPRKRVSTSLSFPATPECETHWLMLVPGKKTFPTPHLSSFLLPRPLWGQTWWGSSWGQQGKNLETGKEREAASSVYQEQAWMGQERRVSLK